MTKQARACHPDREAESMMREIAEMEQELDDRYRELGKHLLELVDREGRSINRLVDRIVDAQKKMEARLGKGMDE